MKTQNGVVLLFLFTFLASASEPEHVRLGDELLKNGNFESKAARADRPDGWNLSGRVRWGGEGRNRWLVKTPVTRR